MGSGRPGKPASLLEYILSEHSCEAGYAALMCDPDFRQAVAMVVDSSDRDRIGLVKDELLRMLATEAP